MVTKYFGRTFTIACAVGLSLTGCSSSLQSANGSAAEHNSNLAARSGLHAAAPRAKESTPPPPPVIATAAPVQHPGIKLAINSLHRDASGVVVLTWTLTNNSNDNFSASSAFVAINKYTYISASEITLLDASRNIRYHTLRDAKTNYCVCTIMGIVGAHAVISPGKSAQYYDAYTVAGNMSKATVEVPGFTGVKDVPIN